MTNLPEIDDDLQLDSWSCYARAAAKIVGEQVDAVFQFVGHDGSRRDPASPHPDQLTGFCHWEIAAFLLSRGYLLGTYLQFNGGDEKQLTERKTFRMEIAARDIPGIVGVKSVKLVGCTHCLAWTGGTLFDPCKKDPVAFGDYDVVDWWPVLPLEVKPVGLKIDRTPTYLDI